MRLSFCRLWLTSKHTASFKKYSTSKQLQLAPSNLESNMTRSIYFADKLKYNLPEDLTEGQLANFPAYKIWINAISKSLDAQSAPNHPYHQNPYKFYGVTVQSIDRFRSDKLGFVKLKADIRTDDDQTLPGTIFMRGGSVAMLLVLSVQGSADEEYAILTNQPRIPAGTLSFLEIPAGMIDDSGTFSGAAAKEIKEETGLTIEESELIDMTQLTLQASSKNDTEGHQQVLQDAIYPSPGGSDEFIPLFLVRKTMSKAEIEELQGKLTGLRDHGEKISLKIVKLRDAWKVAARDAKTLSALCLYDGLRREGRI